MSMVAVSPERMVPRSQWTTSESYPFVGLYGIPSSALLFRAQSPWLEVAETNSTPAGKKSLTYQVKSLGRRLVLVMVKVIGSPTAAVSELAVISREAFCTCACAVPAARTAIVIPSASSVIICFFTSIFSLLWVMGLVPIAVWNFVPLLLPDVLLEVVVACPLYASVLVALVYRLATREHPAGPIPSCRRSKRLLGAPPSQNQGGPRECAEG